MITKIEVKIKEKEKLKYRLEELENLKINEFIEEDEVEIINKEIGILKQLLYKNKFNSIEDYKHFFDEIDINPTELRNMRTKFMINAFMVGNDITTLVAPQNAGKSTLAIAIANYYLDKESNAKVIYLDFDNSKDTLAERGIGELKEKFNERLRYLCEAQSSAQNMLEAFTKLTKIKFKDTLIVIDNIKNLIVGDRDKNRDVSKAMSKLKHLRSNGATILVLHHTNKPGKDGELVFAGSSAFLEDTANAYLVQRNDFKQAFVLEILKNRTGKLKKNIAFKFNNTHSLLEIDFADASETEEIVEINEAIIKFIKKRTEKPSNTEIVSHLGQLKYSRNKVRDALKKGLNRYWIVEKLSRNNISAYSLIS